MKKRNRRSEVVELLMNHPDHVVAEMMGVKLRTVIRWSGMRDIADALRAREQEQKRAIARISRQAVLLAATNLCQVAADQVKPAEPKILLEVLKASGAFEPEQVDPGEALAEVIQRCCEVEDS